MQLADNIRDVRGDINKEVKSAVKLAFGGLVAPRDNQDSRVPQRTADDDREAQRLLIGRHLPPLSATSLTGRRQPLQCCALSMLRRLASAHLCCRGCMLVRCFADEAYRKSCRGYGSNTQTDEYGRKQFRLATAIAWAPGRPSKTPSPEVMLVEAQARADLPQQLTAAQIAYTELWVSPSCPQISFL